MQYHAPMLRQILFFLFSAMVSCTALAGPSTLEMFSPEQYVTTVAQPMYFPVSRSGDAGYDIVLNYHTADGSAKAGIDYLAVNNFLTLPANSLGAFLPVVIRAGSPAGPNKSFQLLIDSAVGAGPPPSLAARQGFTVGTSPYSVVAADVNGDGKLDLFVGNTDDNTVSVLLNTTVPGAGTPSFSAQQVFATGPFPIVTAGDINGDGKPDIIVGNENNNTISVLLNTTAPGAATSSFSMQQTFAAVPHPRSIVTADVNGDGRPDVVVANVLDGTVSVLLNTTVPGATTSSFAPAVAFPTGGGSVSVTVTDINGDGMPDLIVVNFAEPGVSVLLNTTVPGALIPSFSTQQSFATGSSPSWVTVTDINGDGKSDLVVNNNGTVSVLLNTTALGSTTPNFAVQQVFDTGLLFGSFTIAAADINGDGKPDLVVGGSDPVDGVAVLLNVTAPGSSTANFLGSQKFLAGAEPVALTMADINGDGKPDVIVANLALKQVSVLLNNTPPPTATSTFADADAIGTGSHPTSIAAADLNGDGKRDLIVANLDDNTVSVLANNTVPGSSTLTFAAQQLFSTGLAPVAVTTTDINGDGLLDLVVADRNSEVGVLLNMTTPGSATMSFASQTPFGVGANSSSVAIADINDDGKPDLIVANSGDGNISVLLNTTASGAATPSFTGQLTFATGSSPSWVTALDVNGDGKPDLAITNYANASVSVFLNTTAPGALVPSFSPQTTFTTGPNPLQVKAADLDGDGKLDLIVLNENFQSVSVLRNTTAPGATTPSFFSQQAFFGAQPSSIAVEDVNGDGKLDLLVTNGASGVLSVLLNTTPSGSTTLQFAQGYYAVPLGSGSAIVSDLNGDGRPDVILANPLNKSVSVLANTQYETTIAGNPATGTILREIIFANGFE